MTKTLTPILRETLATFRHNPLVIELRARTMVIREKGSRSGYEVSYEQIYTMGAKNAADAAARDRAKRRHSGISSAVR